MTRITTLAIAGAFIGVLGIVSLDTSFAAPIRPIEAAKIGLPVASVIKVGRSLPRCGLGTMVAICGRTWWGSPKYCCKRIR